VSIRKLLLAAAAAAIALPAAANANGNAGPLQSVTFKARLQGRQVSEWDLNRTDTVGPCTVQTSSIGGEHLTFRTPGLVTVRITVLHGRAVQIDGGSTFGAFVTRAIVTRDSVTKIGLEGPCAAGNWPPPPSDCGTKRVRSYTLTMTPVDRAKTWVALSSLPGEPDVFDHCDPAAASYPDLLSNYGYHEGERIAVQVPTAEVLNPQVPEITLRAGGTFDGTVNQAKVRIWLRWKLTLTRCTPATCP
jgi:hypothetical protein